MDYSEEKIQDILKRYFMSVNGAKYIIENLFIYRWESDYIYVSKSNYAYECEIKISRQDFLNDFKHKKEKHQILEGTYELKKYDKNEYPFHPNYFYYVVPENLIKIEEIPSYAGLIYISEKYPFCHIIKKAPKINDEKFDEQKLNLVEKFYYNYRHWKEYSKKEIEPLKELLVESKFDKDGNKFKYNIKEANDLLEEKNKIIKDLKERNSNLDKKFEYLSGYILEIEKILIDNQIKTYQELHDLKHKIRHEILYGE